MADTDVQALARDLIALAENGPPRAYIDSACANGVALARAVLAGDARLSALAARWEAGIATAEEYLRQRGRGADDGDTRVLATLRECCADLRRALAGEPADAAPPAAPLDREGRCAEGCGRRVLDPGVCGYCAAAAPAALDREGLGRLCWRARLAAVPVVPWEALPAEERAEVEEIRGRLTTRRALDIDAPNDDVADLIRLIDRLTSPAQPTPTKEDPAP